MTYLRSGSQDMSEPDFDPNYLVPKLGLRLSSLLISIPRLKYSLPSINL